MNISEISYTVDNGLSYPVFIKQYQGVQLEHKPDHHPKLNGNIVIMFSYTGVLKNKKADVKALKKYFKSNSPARVESRILPTDNETVIYNIEVRFTGLKLVENDAIIIGETRLHLEPVTYDKVDKENNTINNVNGKSFHSTASSNACSHIGLKGEVGSVEYRYFNYTGKNLLIWTTHDAPIDCPAIRPETEDFEGRLFRVADVTQRKTGTGGNLDCSVSMSQKLSSGGNGSSRYVDELTRVINGTEGSSGDGYKPNNTEIVTVRTAECIKVDTHNFVMNDLLRVDKFNIILSGTEVNRMSEILFNRTNQNVNNVNVTYEYFTTDVQSYPEMFSMLNGDTDISKVIGNESDETKIVITNTCRNTSKIILKEDFEKEGWYLSVALLKGAEKEKKDRQDTEDKIANQKLQGAVIHNDSQKNKIIIELANLKLKEKAQADSLRMEKKKLKQARKAKEEALREVKQARHDAQMKVDQALASAEIVREDSLRKERAAVDKLLRAEEEAKRRFDRAEARAHRAEEKLQARLDRDEERKEAKAKLDRDGAEADNKAKRNKNKDYKKDRKRDRKKQKRKEKREAENDKHSNDFKDAAGKERASKAEETALGNAKTKTWFSKIMDVVKTVATVITAIAASIWAVFRFIL